MLRFTYDLNTNGCLILYADFSDQEEIRAIIAEHGRTNTAEYEVLEHLLANSELDWIRPEEIGALTDAPILGLRGEQRELTTENPELVHVVGHWDGKTWYEPVIAAWGFMDYQVRSFLDDLVANGKAIFIS